MRWKKRAAAALALMTLFTVPGLIFIHKGFSAKDEPSFPERLVARFARDLSIPHHAVVERNPWNATPDALREGRETFLARCSSCHGFDGKGRTSIGRNMYPKPRDLTALETQRLSDGEIHYIIANGVRLTGMPAWENPHEQVGDIAWKLVLFIRDLKQPGPHQLQRQIDALKDATYVKSSACQKCHSEIYERWKTTPMANVVRDPKEHPEAILPDLSKNPFAKFTKEQVALVYGSVWKQRYFTKIGDDYFPQPAQWDISAKVWRPYFVQVGTDWWATLYPPDNFQRPTGPTCDGCHSVGYDIHTKQVAEWNVGCERCHGPGSEHVAHPMSSDILNPSRMDSISANDICIQCHSQGRPLRNPIEGQYYDWPVAFKAGLSLKDYWHLEDHRLGEQTFTHFPDGTAHKNRMQGNDFVQSVMYRRGVTCFSCHDVHGTSNDAQLRKPADELCLDCHGPMSPNGPRAATLEEHTHHKEGSPGSRCVACHMPKIEVTIAETKVHAHTFAFIYPSETDKYKIPNPCTSCHADKPTSWATEALQSWPGYSPWRAD